jgi:predicted nucleotide-binding protein (sugar kinase/HSP70/actin superfamily)
MKKIISFPHLGIYHVPIEILLKLIFKDHIIMTAPKITKRTLEIGSKHSPDFVCVPFKYNLGNFIEALDAGANVLIQAGGGCRYGYYAEIQELILRDLGYEFEFIKLIGSDLHPLNMYKSCKRIGTSLTFGRFCYYLLLVIRMVRIIDDLEAFIRENIGFETEKGSFEKLHGEFLESLKKVKTFHKLEKLRRIYTKKFKALKTDKPENCLKVGIVGELYTIMEPFCNYFMEKELALNNIQVSRYITVTFLLFQKKREKKKVLKAAEKYLKYHIGADGTDSVERSKTLAEQGYDGIIHVKPFGCMPEVNAMPMLQNISRDYHIPVLYFSFDSQTSEVGVKTRLEAFCDMLTMKKEGYSK